VCSAWPPARRDRLDPRPLGMLQHKALARLFVLRELLQPLPDSQIVLIMDAFDTLVLGTGQQIVATFRNQTTQILVSAEGRTRINGRIPAQVRYDRQSVPLCERRHDHRIRGALRYLAHTCIATRSGLRARNDQGLLGKFVFDTFDTPSFVRLDTSCELFWVTTRDAEALRESPFRNPFTDTRPLILHVIGGGREHAQLYEKSGRRSWEREIRLDSPSVSPTCPALSYEASMAFHEASSSPSALGIETFRYQRIVRSIPSRRLYCGTPVQQLAAAGQVAARLFTRSACPSAARWTAAASRRRGRSLP